MTSSIVDTCFFVVTCSRKAHDNVELIRSAIDNGLPGTFLGCCEAVGASSMGQGHNQAVKRYRPIMRNNDVWVFTHTDVEFWGGPVLWDALIKKTQEAGSGFVGLAGATRLEGKGVWWQSQPYTLRGSVSHSGKTPEDGVWTSSFGKYGEAVVMDGVLLAITAGHLDKLGAWPEDLGWHFYDIEMTLRAHRAGMRNHVVPFPVMHKSVGPLGPEWEHSRRMFVGRNTLPAYMGELDDRPALKIPEKGFAGPTLPTLPSADYPEGARYYVRTIDRTYVNHRDVWEPV